MLSADLPPEALQLLARASRHETHHAGGRMVWHRWGEGEPLVLLHGGSGSWNHWVANIDALAGAGRSVWAADLPGCGESDLPVGGTDADSLVEPVAEGLRQLFDAAPVDGVGFSFGGLVTGLLAAAAPDLLRQLVIVGAPALPQAGESVHLKEWRQLPTAQERAAAHRYNLASLMLHDRRLITPEVLAMHTANLARDRLRRRRLVKTDALQQALLHTRVPLAAIFGREDALYRGRFDVLEAGLRAMPAMRSVCFIEGAGHWVQYEAPRAFERALLQALG